ncbi:MULTISPECIES: YhdP family phospholipid transporter [Candidatus Ichthyocystis]|uniref:YhdP family phospholipid transporter n=1 Tax=Candidatus Ichthyocystis TaxID=2929841 RepID=UPI000B89CB14|nr:MULTISPECIES: AsmA-like C-terminal region-containing protein [Ichthyocystis]
MKIYFRQNRRWLLVVVAIFACIFGSSLARFAHENIRDFESRWKGKTVVIGDYRLAFSSLDLSLLSLYPHVTARGVHVYSGTDTKKNIDFSKVIFYSTWWSLLRGYLRPSSIDVDGVTLSVVHTLNHFELNNFTFDDILLPLGGYYKSSTAKEFLQSVKEISLHNLDLSWLEGKQKKVIRFSGGIDGRLLRVSSTRISFIVDLFRRGKYYHSATISGYATYENNRLVCDDYVDFLVNGLDLQAVRFFMPSSLEKIKYSGLIDFSGRVAVTDNIPSGVQGELVSHGIKISDQHFSWEEPYLAMDVGLYWGNSRFSTLYVRNIRNQKVSFGKMPQNYSINLRWTRPFSLENLQEINSVLSYVATPSLKNLFLITSRQFFPHYESVINRIPYGIVRDFNFKWHRHGNDPLWDISASVGGTPSDGFLWLKHLDEYQATILGNQDRGDISLDHATVLLDPHSLLRNVSKWKSQVSGKLFWRSDKSKEAMCFGAKSISIMSALANFNGRFEYCPDGSGQNSVKLNGTLFPKSLEFLRDHLPDAVSYPVRSWIKHSFISGSIPYADVRVSGGIDSKGNFSSHTNWYLGINLKDTSISLGNGISFTNVDGMAKINNSSLDASGSCSFGAIPVKKFRLLINDFHTDDFNSNILIQAKTSEAKVSDYAVALSSLSNVVTIPGYLVKYFKSPDFLGSLKIQNMMLSIPLWGKSDSDNFSYSIYVEGSNLRKDFAYNGSIYHLVSDRALANVCNGSYFIDFGSLLMPPKFWGKGYIAGNSLGDVAISAVSKGDIHSLFSNILGVKLPSVYLNGSFDAYVGAYRSFDTDSWNVRVDSNLVGIFSAFPEPFHKNVRNGEWPVSILYTAHDDSFSMDVFLKHKHTCLKLSYAPLDDFSKDLSNYTLSSGNLAGVSGVPSSCFSSRVVGGDHEYRLSRLVSRKEVEPAHAVLPHVNANNPSSEPNTISNNNYSGNTGSVAPAQEKDANPSSMNNGKDDANKGDVKKDDGKKDEVNKEDGKFVWDISINTAFIDQNRWISLMRAGVFGQEVGKVPYRLHIFSKKAKLGVLSVDDLAANVTISGNKILSQISSSGLSGTVNWNNDERQLSIRLDSASISNDVSGEIGESKNVIFGWPNIDLYIQSLKFNDVPVGSVKLQVVNQSDKSDVQLFAIQNDNALLEMKGQMILSGGQQINDMDFQGIFYDAGSLLSSWKQKSLIEGGSGVVYGSVSWVGSPLLWLGTSISGTVNLNLEKGEFKQINTGIGSLLGLFNLKELPRRVLLDFHDVLSSGFSFDSLVGSLQINNGILMTQGLDIRGPSSRVMVSGSANTVDRTFDMDFCVLPKVSNTFSVASVLAGFPVAGVISLVAQSIFRDPIGSLLTKSYKVVGPWSDPSIQKISEHCSISPDFKR